MAKIAIIIYSLYHHVATLAESVKAGIESAGHEATIYQVPETLPEETLTILHAPPKKDYPIATTEILTSADGVIFGVPTRFGSMPSQIKSFIDATGGAWASGALYHKPVGVFVSTGSGGGRETTVFSLLSTFAHHGMQYVPLGYAKAFGELTNLDELQGASPWGAGTVAASDGSRQPTENDLKIAKIQGVEFATFVGNEKNVKAQEEPVKEQSTTEQSVKEQSKATAKPATKAQAKAPAAQSKTTTTAEKKRNPVSRFFSKLGKLFD
ncbi:hypothetical protein CANINC_001303 [Pichia inconspicua]|uniref:Flavodoxin-like domain-containing protein n=1 Tax=Pichia inconspicua TaxID=52247 RepID=A0A4T0X3Z1_9ASCO|nr:hypothetical protein CANINC_001303 [[Candida] inconspicua]